MISHCSSKVTLCLVPENVSDKVGEVSALLNKAFKLLDVINTFPLSGCALYKWF